MSGFQPEEEANDPKFAEALAKLGDVLCERRLWLGTPCACIDSGHHKIHSEIGHGSPDGKRAETFRRGARQPTKPFVVVLGGSKVSDKIDVLKALMEKADTILIGGAMANTFLKAQGILSERAGSESDQGRSGA